MCRRFSLQGLFPERGLHGVDPSPAIAADLAVEDAAARLVARRQPAVELVAKDASAPARVVGDFDAARVELQALAQRLRDRVAEDVEHVLAVRSLGEPRQL